MTSWIFFQIWYKRILSHDLWQQRICDNKKKTSANEKFCQKVPQKRENTVVIFFSYVDVPQMIFLGRSFAATNLLREYAIYQICRGEGNAKSYHICMLFVKDCETCIYKRVVFQSCRVKPCMTLLHNFAHICYGFLRYRF